MYYNQYINRQMYLIQCNPRQVSNSNIS